MIVDLDRALTEIGARALATDYRLGGPAATAAAGKHLAGVVLAVGLDGTVPFGALEVAAATLAASANALPETPEGIAVPNVVARFSPSPIGPPRRGPEGVLLDVKAGRIPPSQAAVIFARSVARQGFARTLARTLAAARRLWRSRASRRA
jgi:hypothetical protein